MSDKQEQIHQHKHHHHHDHSHGHGHNHDHVEGRIGVVFWLNLVFGFIELIGGYLVNSTAIMADALHDFGDALALGLAWILERKSKTKADQNYSYGLRRLSVASALITSGILIFGSVWVVIQAIPKILHPEMPELNGMIALAFLGLIVNGASFFRMSQGNSLNEKALRWHFIEDISGWAMILILAIILKFFPFPILDPILGMGLALWILWNVVKNIKKSIDVFLQGVPSGLQFSHVEKHILDFQGVKDVHHLHIWTVDGQSHILTAHVIISENCSLSEIAKLKSDIKKMLNEHFSILEATLEFECPNEICADPSHLS